ncbi:MAG: ABC transporter permease [Candidatus Margulisbacteria bacterium]|nr:ABC transporter permease [Candidatus Margulisiibacteriota bacterium]MBU1022555.1 ABC transporter permease [Candidatus Margulisiibacteriota bacterium]MBU1728841.1 ABC transporter permease [Candidatus Margulisiibacteriota bacterium]MBU1955472.1 ABC transporter permease [Candidatus Margulisiibacteriota bacterium]
MINSLFNWLGQYVMSFIEELGEMVSLALQTLKSVFSRKFDITLIFDQMKRIGYDSLQVALVTILFVGMVFAIQIAYEFVKFGANKVVGGVVGIAIARELAPLLTGVVLAGRVGASIAAELGTMKVTQQIDALRSMGTSPIRYLVLPRFVAAALMLPALTILADVVGFLGGYAVAVWLVGISSSDFINSVDSFLKMSDVVGGLLKTVVFGMIIATVACYKGMRAKGGAKGVGEATTVSVVISLITIFVVNYFMSVMLFR